MRLHYQDGAALNGNSESGLTLWKLVGATWTSQGFSARSTADNWVELSPVTLSAIGEQWTLATANTAPAAVNDSNSTDENTNLTVAAPGVLGNDTDTDPLTVAEVNGSAASVGTEITLGSGAKVTLNANGSYTYKPNGAFESLDTGETATDSFTYKASDGTALSNSATVTITITGVNDAPVCQAVSITTNENTVGSTAPNCSDVDIEPLTYAVSPATTGISGTSAGNLTYNPNGQFEGLDTGETGSDSFTYTANDGTASSVSANVAVTITGVNDAPVAVNDGNSTDENTNVSAAAPGVLGNDSDVDVEPLTVGEVNGSAASAGPRSPSARVPRSPSTRTARTQQAQRRVRVPRHRRDRHRQLHLQGLGRDRPVQLGTVTITITGVNDAPAAVNDSGTTDENTTLSRARRASSVTTPMRTSSS